MASLFDGLPPPKSAAASSGGGNAKPNGGGGGGPTSGTTTLALASSTPAGGSVDFSALHRHGDNRNKVVHADHGALVPKLTEVAPDALARPDEDAIRDTAARTSAALQLKVDTVLSAAQPKSLAPRPGEARYVRYTPSQGAGPGGSGGQQRLVRISDAHVDPLEPPKFKHKRVPRGPGSPPVPVLHSPPRKLTKEDQLDWKIPPCISNWKNRKGYTIPLDKRLAADGRGLQEATINDNFAKLSEAMYVAEQKAREAIEVRARIQREVLTQEKQRKEDELRQLAQRARMERSGLAAPIPAPTDHADVAAPSAADAGGGWGGPARGPAWEDEGAEGSLPPPASWEGRGHAGDGGRTHAPRGARGVARGPAPRARPRAAPGGARPARVQAV